MHSNKDIKVYDHIHTFYWLHIYVGSLKALKAVYDAKIEFHNMWNECYLCCGKNVIMHCSNHIRMTIYFYVKNKMCHLIANTMAISL